MVCGMDGEVGNDFSQVSQIHLIRLFNLLLPVSHQLINPLVRFTPTEIFLITERALTCTLFILNTFQSIKMSLIIVDEMMDDFRNGIGGFIRLPRCLFLGEILDGIDQRYKPGILIVAGIQLNE